MSPYGGPTTCGRLADDSGMPAHALPGDRPVWSRDRVVDVKHSKIDIRLDLGLETGYRDGYPHGGATQRKHALRSL